MRGARRAASVRHRCSARWRCCSASLVGCSQDRYERARAAGLRHRRRAHSAGPLRLAATARASPAAGWSATSFLATIACVEPSGAPATLPPNDARPILTALGDGSPPWAPRRERPGDARSVGRRGRAGVRGDRACARDRRPAVRRRFTGRSCASAALVRRCSTRTTRTPAGAATTGLPRARPASPCGAGRAGLHDAATPSRGACSRATRATARGTRIYPPRDSASFRATRRRRGPRGARRDLRRASPAGFPCSTCHPVHRHRRRHRRAARQRHRRGDLRPERRRARGELRPLRPALCAVTCHDPGGADAASGVERDDRRSSCNRLPRVSPRKATIPAPAPTATQRPTRPAPR